MRKFGRLAVFCHDGEDVSVSSSKMNCRIVVRDSTTRELYGEPTLLPAFDQEEDYRDYPSMDKATEKVNEAHRRSKQ